MVDKSVERIEVIMRRNASFSLPDTKLANGFRFSFYTEEKDGWAWAEIQTAVGQFGSVWDAYQYFRQEFCHEREMKRRMMFIENENGEKIATSTAWWTYTGQRRDPILHWVAVKNEYQGLGLGKAIIFEVVRLMTQIEGEREFFLNTQTVSHKAIKIYEKVGFFITDERNLIGTPNDRYTEAVALLAEIDKR